MIIDRDTRVDISVFFVNGYLKQINKKYTQTKSFRQSSNVCDEEGRKNSHKSLKLRPVICKYAELFLLLKSKKSR